MLQGSVEWRMGKALADVHDRWKWKYTVSETRYVPDRKPEILMGRNEDSAPVTQFIKGFTLKKLLNNPLSKHPYSQDWIYR